MEPVGSGGTSSWRRSPSSFRLGRSTRRHRLSDQRPWWDTFPWWGAVILAILVWMAFKIITDDDYDLAWTRIWPGLRITIEATAEIFAIALVIGLVFGMGQLSRNVVSRNVARTYVEFVRGIPILPLMFTLALVIVPQVTNALNGRLDAWCGWEFKLSFQWRAVVTVALIYGAYMAEVFRGGIQSIPPGQVEAGRSLGLSRRQTMNSVVLPQAMRAIIPPLGNDSSPSSRTHRCCQSSGCSRSPNGPDSSRRAASSSARATSCRSSSTWYW